MEQINKMEVHSLDILNMALNKTAKTLQAEGGVQE